MRLLIITQKVDENDSVLGFFHRWLKEFSKHCESVIVVCLEKGEYHLSKNVRVLSLGKEQNKSRIKYVRNFYKYIHEEKDNYDAIFVHMNPIYVVLSGLFWRIWHKKIALWYTHKSIDLKLRLAEKLSNIIFTASKESFRLRSDKIIVTGHGIDTDFFRRKEHVQGDNFNIITIGRISPIKEHETLIEAIKILVKDKINVRVKIVGGPGTPNQSEYLDKITKKVEVSGLSKVINFVGEISNKDVGKYLQEADVFVNLSRTGSLDKAILEAMSCEVPVLTSNEGLRSTLEEFMFFEPNDSECLAEKIKYLHDRYNKSYDDLASAGKAFREKVIESHSLPKLIEKIIKKL